jgi:hypothetical protein
MLLASPGYLYSETAGTAFFIVLFTWSCLILVAGGEERAW